jgi:nickel-type superoxide dismutase maturation protease
MLPSGAMLVSMLRTSRPRFGAVRIAGPSMVPTVRPGDLCLVRWGGRVGPGKLVVARHPERPELLIVKRVLRRDDRGWWLSSDNPLAGGDSETFGAVPDRLVLGRVLLRYWPPRRP